jgi:hypothetical protein
MPRCQRKESLRESDTSVIPKYSPIMRLQIRPRHPIRGLLWASIMFAQEGRMPRNKATGGWQRLSYEMWCQCARLLLGWAEGDAVQWPALYRAGLTPLQAARETGFGDAAADVAVWI